MTAAGRSSGFTLLLLCPVVSWAVLAGVDYYPTLSAAGAAGVRAMLAAQGLVTAVVYATLLPVLREVPKTLPAGRLQAALKMGVVRFVAVLGLSGLLAWRRVFSPGPLLVWVGVTYVVMIQAETLALVRWMKRLEDKD